MISFIKRRYLQLLSDENTQEFDMKDLWGKSSFFRNKNHNIATFIPKKYGDVIQITEHIKTNKTAIINLSIINNEDYTRIIDFLSGVSYVISGHIQKIGEKLFLLAPKNVDIDEYLSKTVAN
ncbi:cell division protein SepF [symbiont of Argiope bruennichi]|uniref:cell division protein SepF n=1 Tax=symbiont of Argiope bruennichi TaxID=2810479 RepID=UPI003DA6C4D0